MKRINLMIKYKGQYMCEKIHNEIDFIHIPNYFDKGDFSNISIFMTLFVSNLLDENYYSKTDLKDMEWASLFEQSFYPELLFQMDEHVFLYDLDEFMSLQKGVCISLPSNFVLLSGYEKQILDCPKSTFVSEEIPYGFHSSSTFIRQELFTMIQKLKIPRTDKDVLLMYSGGKDSTLSIIRLLNMGYSVHLLHFDNGHMRDTNKPFLTYQKTLSDLEGVYFPYQFSSINIHSPFHTLFSDWKNQIIEHGSIDSEIQCLSCRSAMYIEAIKLAEQYHYRYIAEGARTCQQFFIEQPIMLERFRKLASQSGIQLLLPVLTLDDDQVLISELLSYGLSSKSWESKCLLGKEPKIKDQNDEKVLLDYYENSIKPKLLSLKRGY